MGYITALACLTSTLVVFLKMPPTEAPCQYPAPGTSRPCITWYQACINTPSCWKGTTSSMGNWQRMACQPLNLHNRPFPSLHCQAARSVTDNSGWN